MEALQLSQSSTSRSINALRNQATVLIQHRTSRPNIGGPLIHTDSTTSKTSNRHKKRCVAGDNIHLPGRLATSPHFSYTRIKSFFSPSKSRINSGKARNSPRKHGGSAPSTPPVSSQFAIPVPDSYDAFASDLVFLRHDLITGMSGLHLPPAR